MLENNVDETTAQLLKTLGTVLAFAVIGAVRTIYAAQKNGESWQWAKGKYEVVAMGIVGAIAGVYTLSVGADIGSAVFVGAVTVLGIVAREMYQIATTSHDRYGELREANVGTFDAALLSLQHGIEQNDPEEALAAVQALLGEHGTPDREEIDRHRERLAEQYTGEGARDDDAGHAGSEDLQTHIDQREAGVQDYDPDREYADPEPSDGTTDDADRVGGGEWIPERAPQDFDPERRTMFGLRLRETGSDPEADHADATDDVDVVTEGA